ncbi:MULTISPECIES: hypothetical protein [Sorangium]|uniref:hypothetical protein n=1 Tax=Sorangium TaxID=39643 RepID=UPI003D9C651C
MRSSGSVQLEAWVASQGGLRAAARLLGVGHGTVRRWVTGEHLPDDRTALEGVTGVPAGSWDQAAVPAGQKPPRRPAEAARTPEPVQPKPRPARSTREAAKAEQEAPEVDQPEPPPPASLQELQARARQIPGEMQQLRGRIAAGAVAFSPGEVLARMLEREARACASAITAAGTATVEEVEQLRALVLNVTQGCEGCRARVTEALRNMTA